MTDIPEFVNEHRARAIFEICRGECSVVSMETCRMIARLWAQSDDYRNGIMLDILGDRHEPAS
jgi:hypothetical protein